MFARIIVLFLGAATLFADSSAQPSVDTAFSWRSYAREGTTHVLIFPGRSDDPSVVVLRELADNAGTSTLTDISHIVELIDRVHGVDPEVDNLVLHRGMFMYCVIWDLTL